MALFHATGVIVSDLVRKETSKGVLSSFRMSSGVKGRGQLWVDVEAWGHQAGVLSAHGANGRGVTIAGRLTQRSWRSSSGQLRSKLVVTVLEFDFFATHLALTHADVQNHVLVNGPITTDPVVDAAADSIMFEVADGKAGTKTGRLWLPVEAWGKTIDTAKQLQKGDHVAAAGRLNYRSTVNPENGERTGFHYLSAHQVACIPSSARMHEHA